MPTKPIVTEHESKMKKSTDVFQSNLKSIRTGQASTGLVENLTVNYYGTPTPLKQMSTLATPEPDLIIIKPFDPSSLKEIEKAIKSSDLSIAPVNDGKMIRLSVPPLSEERRNQLVQQVKQLGEQAKVGIRNIRRDANKIFEKQQKDKLISEDDMSSGKKQIDDLTKKYTAQIESVIKAKSDEIILE